ncbi:MAG: ATP-binding protein [Bacteroidales bacterium]|nr:ATP-binding protein [Bacteroidales bacterium]
MIKRNLQSRILNLLEHFPAVAILGPRQIGKTTLAKSLVSYIDKDVVYLDLELPVDLNKLSNPQTFFENNSNKCLVIDEIQRVPDLFPVIRAVIDQHRVPGRFIILGSASPELLKQSSETLAGRIVYTELTSLLISETEAIQGTNDLWLKGGFPEPFLITNQSLLQEWYQSFIRTYIERDLPLLGLKADPLLLNRLLNMLAHNHGMLLNQANLSKSLGVSSPTVSKYINFLESAFIVRLLQPWHSNIKKRLVKSPKVYLRDSGILHHLHNIHDYNSLLGHPILGYSWEGFVVEQIINSINPGTFISFYRTAEGAESDLILTRGMEILTCIEIKFSDAPKTTKSFTTAIQDLHSMNNFIVVPNCPEPYLIKKNVTVCNPNQFLQKYLPEIV